MDLELAGKRAIVTGASRGIGYAIAESLAREGVDIALIAREKDALDVAAARMGEHGHRVIAVATDTTDDAAVRAMVSRTALEFGGVDILVNAAARPGGATSQRKLNELEDEDLRIEIETKVLGYLRCARAAAPYMVAQGWGRIVNVSGLAARQTGSVFGSVRNVAVAAMTKNLADELGPAGVNVTVVHPGMTVTERTPGMIANLASSRGVTEADALASLTSAITIGRAITAAEVADVVTFLASPRSVAITGDAIGVGGGARGSIHY
jgi:NAD(P)-dependent dehydrogenase (short-subunit alcohol dehydrogenase family)